MNTKIHFNVKLITKLMDHNIPDTKTYGQTQ